MLNHHNMTDIEEVLNHQRNACVCHWPTPPCVTEGFPRVMAKPSSEPFKLPGAVTNTTDPQDKKKHEQWVSPGCNPIFFLMQNYPDQLPISPHRQICSSLTGTHVVHDNPLAHKSRFHAPKPFVLWTKIGLKNCCVVVIIIKNNNNNNELLF